MGWKKKWAIDSVKALVPFRDSLRRWRRARQPYETNPDVDDYTFTQGLQQIRLVLDSGTQLAGRRALELGTGWLPMIPLLLRVAGCERVILTDQDALADAHTLRSAADFLRARAERIAQALNLRREAVIARLEPHGRTFAELLRGFSFEYRVPFTVETAESSSLHLITSRAVLEHIDQPTIAHLFGHFRRMLLPGGQMCHVIDNSDHWEHADKSISRVHFLKHPDWLMSWLGINEQNYQNRLRHSEYRQLLVAAGFEVVAEIGEPDPAALDALATLALAPRFRGWPKADLAILNSYFLAR